MIFLSCGILSLENVLVYVYKKIITTVYRHNFGLNNINYKIASLQQFKINQNVKNENLKPNTTLTQVSGI